jgi:hypothetical protein
VRTIHFANAGARLGVAFTRNAEKRRLGDPSMSDSVKADKLFDPYEFTGVLMPGAILLVGLVQLVPGLGSLIAVKDITVGGLGLFVILADVAGHLVQSLGGMIEFLWWRPFGWPTARILKPDQRLLSKGQRSDLEQQVHSKLALKDPFRIADLTPQEWSPITRQIYVAVAAASRSSRVDAFNGIYGLSRGLAAAFFVLAVVTLIQNRANWLYALGLVLAAALSLYRMREFGFRYATELFVQFLQLPMSDSASETKPIT